jgi:hypothetical protein
MGVLGGGAVVFFAVLAMLLLRYKRLLSCRASWDKKSNTSSTITWPDNAQHLQEAGDELLDEMQGLIQKYLAAQTLVVPGAPARHFSPIHPETHLRDRLDEYALMTNLEICVHCWQKRHLQAEFGNFETWRQGNEQVKAKMDCVADALLQKTKGSSQLELSPLHPVLSKSLERLNAQFTVLSHQQREELECVQPHLPASELSNAGK